MMSRTSTASSDYEKALSKHFESLKQPLVDKLKEITTAIPPEIHALWFLTEPESIQDEGFPVVLQGEVPPDEALPENFDAVPLLPKVPAPDLPHFDDPSFEDSDESLSESERIALRLMGDLVRRAWLEAGGPQIPIHAAFGDSYLVKELNLNTGEWTTDA